MKTREVTITVNDPEPSDTLPFDALVYKGVVLALYERRHGSLVTQDGEEVDESFAHAFGLPIKLGIVAVVE